MKYITMDGKVTNCLDPNRSVWYSAMCGYWTDDWDNVATTSGKHNIPCCPTCKCPGYYGSFQQWDEGAMKYESDGHPGYTIFLEQHKEKCSGRGFSFEKAYTDWKERN